MRLTVKAAKEVLKRQRMSITSRDREYRVTFDKTWDMTAQDREGCAYYTDDLQDAMTTGCHMAAEHSARAKEEFLRAYVREVLKLA